MHLRSRLLFETRAVSLEKSTQPFHSHFQYCLLPRGGAYWSINNNKHKFQTQQGFTHSAPPTYLQIKCFMRGLAKLGEAMPGCGILEDNKDLGTKPILQPLRKESVREKDKSDWACLGLCVYTLALFHYKANKKPFPDKTYAVSHNPRAESPHLLLPEVDKQGSKQPLQVLIGSWKAGQRPAPTVQPRETPSASNNIFLYSIRPPLSWRIPKHFTLFIHRNHFTSHWTEERNNNPLFSLTRSTRNQCLAVFAESS